VQQEPGAPNKEGPGAAVVVDKEVVANRDTGAEGVVKKGISAGGK
jgi:hypothetical protein